jgi:hypothetical protein
MDEPFHKKTEYLPHTREGQAGDSGPEAPVSTEAEKSVAERAASGARAAAATSEARQPDDCSESLDWYDTALLDCWCLPAAKKYGYQIC